MIRAVLFDLDGTLLDIDLDVFLGGYFNALGPVLAKLTGLPTATALRALHGATQAMFGDHGDRSNRDVFDAEFQALSGVNLASREARTAVDAFYAVEFPRLQGTCGPRAGGNEAVAAAIRLGLPVALATNPIFPRAAIVERLRWAGLTPDVFATVTTYETACACKPSPAYFRAIAAQLNVDASECLMVGDDQVLDLGASHAGMRTFYVGPGRPDTADYCGTLDELATRLGEMLE